MKLELGSVVSVSFCDSLVPSLSPSWSRFFPIKLLVSLNSKWAGLGSPKQGVKCLDPGGP